MSCYDGSMAGRTARNRGRRAREKRRLVAACIAVVVLVFGAAFLAYLLLRGKEDPAASPAATGDSAETAVAADGSQTEQKPFTTYGEAQDVEEETPSAAEDATERDPEEEDAASGMADEAAVREKLQSMTLQEKVAQLFIITPEQLTGFRQVTQCGETTRAAFDRYPVGGLIYFPNNFESKEQTRQMLQAMYDYAAEQTGIPLFLAVDEEGGRVARVADSLEDIPQTPPMGELAHEGEEAVYEAALVIGNYLSGLGFNLDFAPDADVLTNPDNTVIGDRAFGADAETVAGMADAYRRGLAQSGVLGVYKHFPGHGGTAEDTHEGYAWLGKNTEELKETDLIPFRDGIEKDVPMIMVAHISLPQITGSELPASLSKEVVTDLLRNDMGYGGVVVTDALNMGAIAQHYSAAQSAVTALEAGCDILLMPSDFVQAYEAVLNAVENGTLPEERIDGSVYRILTLKHMSQDSLFDQ